MTNLTKKIAFVSIIALGMIILGHVLELRLPDLEHWVLGLGHWGPIVFIILFAILTPLMISVDALCFAAGLLFSLFNAEFYMILGTYFSAAFIFFIGRFLFKNKIENFLERQHKSSDVITAIEQYSFKMMFLLRLTPLPFALLSYIFAVSPVRFWPYIVSTSGIFIYNGTLVYLGYTTKHFAGLISGGNIINSVPHFILMSGLILTIVALFYVSKLSAKTLKELRNKK